LSVNNHIIGTGTIGVVRTLSKAFLTALDVSAGAVIDGVLSIAGYPDVKAAIDGNRTYQRQQHHHWNHMPMVI
jgi:hypothetical protein